MNYLENFHSLWETPESFHRSVALNISNTIKIFNTTNRTSRYTTGDYSDTVGIHLRKFTRKIQKPLEIRFIVIYFQHFSFKTSLG